MRVAADLSPTLRARIGVSQKSGGWKGRVWGRRAEIAPDGAGFGWRVLLNRKWIEGRADNVWAALDSIGAAEPITNEGTQMTKTKTKTKTTTAKGAKGAKALKNAPPAARKKLDAMIAKDAKPGRAKKEKVAAPAAPIQPAAPAAPKGRERFFGKRTTAALQRLGAMGFSVAEAKAALEQFGGTATDSTLRTFVTAGKRGGLKGHNMASFEPPTTALLVQFLAGLRAPAAAGAEG